jgi:hypothetical protein
VPDAVRDKGERRRRDRRGAIVSPSRAVQYTERVAAILRHPQNVYATTGEVLDAALTRGLDAIEQQLQRAARHG